MWAGLIAIADEGRAIVGLGSLDGPSQTLPALYSLPAADFHDITSGSTGPSPEFNAGPGYDLATGIGSPVGNLLVPALVGYQPSVTSINTTAGPQAGGTAVTITGTNLTGGTVVDFGTTPATNVVIVSSTQITATSPAGSGTVNVTVTGPGGTSATLSADQFTYLPPPTVTSLNPKTGPLAGGTSVTITGPDFTGATAVDFGSLAGLRFHLRIGHADHGHQPRGDGRGRCHDNHAGRNVQQPRRPISSLTSRTWRGSAPCGGRQQAARP